MTTGAMIFAHNNGINDYVNMATWCARRIQRWLDIPVTLVTDRDVATDVFDRVITVEANSGNLRWFPDHEVQASWYNLDRCDCFALTPYDRTLVVDADFVINSAQLRTVLHHGAEFMCHRAATEVSRQQEFAPAFGEHRMPQWWATVMVFDKTPMSAYIFDTVRMIRDNWSHYCDLYTIHKSTFRNDYALSIALGLVSGHSLVTQDIPWALMSVLPEHRLEQLDQDRWRVTFSDNGRGRYLVLDGVDFHAMNKRALGEIIADHS